MSQKGAADPIPIAYEIFRGIIPGKCLRYLTRDPFRCRICRDVDPDEVSAVQPYDDQRIQQIKADGRDDEQVHGGNVWCVIAQKGLPGGPLCLTMYLATED
jgi:hypothetical protein